MDLSDEAEHACEKYYLIHWEEMMVLDHSRGQELLAKAALHIQMTPSEEHSTKMEDWKSPSCRTAVMRR